MSDKLSIYITKILKTNNENSGANADALAEIELLTKYLITKLAQLSNYLLRDSGRQTLNQHEVRGATQLLTHDAEFTSTSLNTQKENITLALPRVRRILTSNLVVHRISGKAVVATAAVVEALINQLLTKSVEYSKLDKKVRISPHNIRHAVNNDPLLTRVFRGVVLV